MPNHSMPKERVEYGLDQIAADRGVTVSLRDLMYIHQTLAEYLQFFHQPLHYPDLEAVHEFLGSKGSSGVYDILSESLYRRMNKMLPEDIHQAFDDGKIFEHPLAPTYFDER
ncbi:hypothetical protein [Deefgea rivuli]|uniref:hypothetical protein n=1 Tax=Deefgea rivuli TaxID=400948 RepID=UPI0012EC0B31|nr:hypothetical protein [Deefgea rivuli]